MRNILLDKHGIWRWIRQGSSAFDFTRKSKYGKLSLELFQGLEDLVAFEHL